MNALRPFFTRPAWVWCALFPLALTGSWLTPNCCVAGEETSAAWRRSATSAENSASPRPHDVPAMSSPARTQIPAARPAQLESNPTARPDQRDPQTASRDRLPGLMTTQPALHTQPYDLSEASSPAPHKQLPANGNRPVLQNHQTLATDNRSPSVSPVPWLQPVVEEHDSRRAAGPAGQTRTQLLQQIQALVVRTHQESPGGPSDDPTAGDLQNANVPGPESPAPSQDRWAQWEQERNARLARIEQLIQETLQASRSETVVQNSTAEAATSDAASDSVEPPAADAVAQNAAQPPQGPAEEPSTDHDAALPAASTENSSVQEVRAASPSLAELLSNQKLSPLDGPIDRMGLADNLYAMGEFALALQTYEQIDKSVLPASEALWVDYQIAGANRRLRKYSEASDRYRQLAADPQGGRFSLLSRWWLDRIRDRSQLEADLQRSQQQIQRLKESQHAKRSN